MCALYSPRETRESIPESLGISVSNTPPQDFDVKASSEGRERFRRPLRRHVTSSQPTHLVVIRARRRLLTSSSSALCAHLHLVPSVHCHRRVPSVRRLQIQCRLSSVPMFGRCRGET